MEALLEAEELTKIFQRDGREPVTALDRVSFRLYPGEALGVVGESGSGKSTLLRAALGLLGQGGHVTGGAIRFEGRSLTELPEPETEIPEEEVPLSELPEPEVEIPEEDVPLSDIPKTGDSSGLWMGAALLSGAALLVLTRKREDAEPEEA